MEKLIDEKFLKQCSEKLKKEETVEVLGELYDWIVNKLRSRIDEIKVDDNKAISFFSNGREFLTINITRRNLRVYLHPSSGAFFDPDSEFKVEKFRFWDSSYHKSSGQYRAMSIWISEKKYLSGIKEIIEHIRKT